MLFLLGSLISFLTTNNDRRRGSLPEERCQEGSAYHRVSQNKSTAYSLSPTRFTYPVLTLIPFDLALNLIPLPPILHYSTSPLRRILLYSILETDAAMRFSLTTDVCNEALDLEGCSVVVAYHPPVSFEFRSLSFFFVSFVMSRCEVGGDG